MADRFVTINLAPEPSETIVTTLVGEVEDLITLSGVAANSEDLGTFTGSTIPDNSTVKPALQALETALEVVEDSLPPAVRGALSSTLDFSLNKIWTKTLNGSPYELALSNSVIGETRLLEIDSTAGEDFTLPASCALLSGTYDDTGELNYVFIFCNNTDSYLVTISQEQP